MKSNLLCTFVHRNDLELILQFIEQSYELDNNIIFVLSNMDQPSQYYCTYNVVGQYELTKNTILIHRKSDTNTLYTINALNQIIRNMNNGLVDNDMIIPWNRYSDMMILSSDYDIIKIPLKLEKIHRIKNN